MRNLYKKKGFAVKVKRLVPTKEVLRELYLKSGNQCAFPSCREVMINSQGQFVGQICHIEAAMESGERFNPNQTNEERRAFSNLMLLCRNHHGVTNDVRRYTVEIMKQMKTNHEAIFTDIVEKILETIVDHTDLKEVMLAQSLEKMNIVLKWNLPSKELKESLDELNEFAIRLKKVPLSTRRLLVIMVNRGKPKSFSHGLEVYLPEIEKVTGLRPHQIIEHLNILYKYGMVKGDWEDSHAVLCALKSGWSILSDLKNFCQLKGRELSSILVDLDFLILD